MEAKIDVLYESDVFRIKSFICNCTICSVSNVEYNRSFTFCFIHKGFFEYRTFRRNDEMHTGRILLSKPGYEHTTRHIDDQPDLTTIYQFTNGFFAEMQEAYKDSASWFLLNNEIHALVLQCPVEAEYRHNQIQQLLQKGNAGNLHIDELVMELLNHVLLTSGNHKIPASLPDKLIKQHLPTIEKAKEYLWQHYKENITLQQLARHCLVSTFHFSRLFKSLVNQSPHQYLTAIRLQHARQLVLTTTLPVADIAYECGFNSAEHFTTAYRAQFHTVPSRHRKQLA